MPSPDASTNVPAVRGGNHALAEPVAGTLAGDVAGLITRELPCVGPWQDSGMAMFDAQRDPDDQSRVLITITPYGADLDADLDPIEITARVEIRSVRRRSREAAAIGSSQ